MSINKKTFCTAPWYSIYVNSDKKIAPCCKFKNFKFDYNNIEDYFRSTELHEVRQDLLNGVRNENCAACWKDEDQGGDSMRLISNRTIGRATNTRLLDQIENPKLSNIKSFDLVLGNLCNLKCVMCTPELSSQLLAEANLHPGLKKRYEGKNYSQSQFDWPKTNDFVEWCQRFLPRAIHIKFTGGEPFIIPWITDIIKEIPDDQKKNCVLHFTTNLTIINNKILESFEKFKEVWLSVSVEGTHRTHEYLRYGHSWTKLVNNIEIIKAKKITNLILKINHVVQTPSYHSILEMVKYFDDLEIQIHPIMISSPKHFHIASLTQSAKQQFIDATQNYQGFNLKFVEYVRKASQEYLKQDHDLTRECVEHLSEFDAVRKNSYKDIIPVENLQHV